MFQKNFADDEFCKKSSYVEIIIFIRQLQATPKLHFHSSIKF